MEYPSYGLRLGKSMHTAWNALWSRLWLDLGAIAVMAIRKYTEPSLKDIVSRY